MSFTCCLLNLTQYNLYQSWDKMRIRSQSLVLTFLSDCFSFILAPSDFFPPGFACNSLFSAKVEIEMHLK